MDNKKNAIFIVGPTSSGKSEVAADLAERIGGEVISCDSMQVYRGMDVLTRVPSEEVLSRVKHHLINMIPPEEEFSAARFVEESRVLIDDVISRDKFPIFAGGTGLYMKSLVDGLFSSPPKDEELRKELEGMAKRDGKAVLHERLKAVDPVTAEKLHPNDTRRIVRALEVYELTGRTISEEKNNAEGISGKYNIMVFGLELPREVLYGRINFSVDKMFEQGVLDEMKRLKGRRLSVTAAKALGVKEIFAHFDRKTSVEETKEEMKKNTRRYAKRQLTWFRSDKRIIWINAERKAEDIVRDIERIWKKLF